VQKSGRVGILVVEDEFLLRMEMEDELTNAGFNVLTAANADEAIEILTNRDDIRIIVTDINMPGSMDGAALTRFVRTRWPPIRMIVASGAVPDTDQIPLGIPFFRKPYPHRQIQAKIRELLQAD
jgi:CheY-like chemotaxis protein